MRSLGRNEEIVHGDRIIVVKSGRRLTIHGRGTSEDIQFLS
jgi:hypothetical protein